MNSFASVAIGLVLVVGVGALVFWQTSETQQAQTFTESQGTTQSKEGITEAEVAQHSDAKSCWSIINGSVYDLTSWIPKHPGGPQAILQLCGADGSEKFNSVHGGAAMQAQVLAGFKIGVVKN